MQDRWAALSRIDQCNAIDGGGKKGVSNTMGSCLWGLDLLYELAQEGVSGVNFAGSLTDAGSPILLSGSSPSAGPLFYAMLCFQLGSQGRFIPVNFSNPSGLNLSAYAVLTPNGGMYLTIINKEKSTNANVFINAGKEALQSASYMYLTAASESATSGITLGGGAVKNDGSFSQEPHFSTLPFGPDSTAITVPYSSALILNLQ